MTYYVYVYCDGETPIYIGAGCGYRDVSHLSPSAKGCCYFHRKLRKMQRDGWKPTVRRLLDGLTFQESRDWEQFFIQALGRKDLGTGSLYNLTDGGEGASNVVVSDILKQQRSKAIQATYAQPDMKRRHSEIMKSVCARPGVLQQRSETLKIAFARSGARQRKSVALKIACNRPEVKQRRSMLSRLRPPRGRFKGISPCGKRWQTRIDHQYLGVFPTPEEAALAYNDAVDDRWGGIGWKNPVAGQI